MKGYYIMIKICEGMEFIIAVGGGIWFMYTFNFIILILTVIIVFNFVVLEKILKNQKELKELINDYINK